MKKLLMLLFAATTATALNTYATTQKKSFFSKAVSSVRKPQERYNNLKNQFEQGLHSGLQREYNTYEVTQKHILNELSRMTSFWSFGHFTDGTILHRLQERLELIHRYARYITSHIKVTDKKTTFAQNKIRSMLLSALQSTSEGYKYRIPGQFDNSMAQRVSNKLIDRINNMPEAKRNEYFQPTKPWLERILFFVEQEPEYTRSSLPYKQHLLDKQMEDLNQKINRIKNQKSRS